MQICNAFGLIVRSPFVLTEAWVFIDPWKTKVRGKECEKKESATHQLKIDKKNPHGQHGPLCPVKDSCV